MHDVTTATGTVAGFPTAHLSSGCEVGSVRGTLGVPAGIVPGEYVLVPAEQGWRLDPTLFGLLTPPELRDAIAKAVADAQGHGMREKCERHADAVLQVVGTQMVAQVNAAALRQAPAQGGVTEAMVEDKAREMYEAYRNANPDARMPPWEWQTFQPTLDHWRFEARDALEAALSAQQGPGEGMLPDALMPHADEWYRLCERRFSVDRITISGGLAEAIVKAIAAPPAQLPEGFMEKVRPAVKAAHTKAYRAVVDAQHGTYPSHYLPVLKQDEKFWGELLDEIDAVLAGKANLPAQPAERGPEGWVRASDLNKLVRGNGGWASCFNDDLFVMWKDVERLLAATPAPSPDGGEG